MDGLLYKREYYSTSATCPQFHAPYNRQLSTAITEERKLRRRQQSPVTNKPTPTNQPRWHNTTDAPRTTKLTTTAGAHRLDGPGQLCCWLLCSTPFYAQHNSPKLQEGMLCCCWQGRAQRNPETIFLQSAGWTRESEPTGCSQKTRRQIQ